VAKKRREVGALRLKVRKTVIRKIDYIGFFCYYYLEGIPGYGFGGRLGTF